MRKNEVDLRFSIFDFEDISHDDITKLLDIKPTYIRQKGGRKNPKNPDSPIWGNNIWSMDSGMSKYVSFEDQMNTILNIIEQKIDIYINFFV